MSLDNKPRNKGDPRSSHTSSPHNQQTQGPGEFMPSLASPLVPTQLRILQWNCRSLTKRKNEFQLRLAQHRHSYDAILMQETNVKDPRLSAYNYFHNPAIERKYTKTGPPEARGLATVYLKGTVPHAQIDTQKWCTPDQEVTAVRTLIDNHKLILVSAYVRPTAEDPNFSWIEELRTEDEARERRGRRRRSAVAQGRAGPQCAKLHGLLSTVQLVQQRAGVVRRTKSQVNVVQPHRHDHLNATRPSVQRGAVWCAPIECDIRLCGDLKVTVNPVLKVDHYPVPLPEELFTAVCEGKVFCVLDLSSVYQQVLLSPESKPILTVNTHKRLYQYNRLSFGFASAPALFQSLKDP
ncbi:uncharacterized protein ISCGN_032198 [Ixodes scapularis]